MTITMYITQGILSQKLTKRIMKWKRWLNVSAHWDTLIFGQPLV